MGISIRLDSQFNWYRPSSAYSIEIDEHCRNPQQHEEYQPTRNIPTNTKRGNNEEASRVIKAQVNYAISSPKNCSVGGEGEGGGLGIWLT